MTPVERVGEQSREQHHRYSTLFGSDPVNGDGFTELHTSIRELGQQASDVHAWLAQSGFTSAADTGIAAAAREDRTAFGDAAAIASAAAAAVNSSAELNIRGAAAIAAHMEGEAARLSVIPDKGSPDAVMQALATIDNHQAKSLSTVEHLASTAQDLAQFAQLAGTHPTPAPVQLSQISDSHQLPALAQPGSHTGLQQLAEPAALPPPQHHSATHDEDHQIPAPAAQYIRDETQHDPPQSSEGPDDAAEVWQPNPATNAAARPGPRPGPQR